MNLPACSLLGLLLWSASAVAQDIRHDAGFLSPAIIDEKSASDFKPRAVSSMRDSYSFVPGWFAGVGGSYNSVKIDSRVGGSGLTDIYDNGTLVAVGFAGGPAPPFNETVTTFAPVAQFGYSQNIRDSEWLLGYKFQYKYLGLTIASDGFDAPQVGVYEIINPPSTSTFTGNATTESAQVSVNHEIAMIPFIGRSFGRGSFYIGGGPVVFDTESHLYDLSSYADIDGVRTNVGGRPLTLAHSTWLWGGAAQMGMIYNVSPACYLDFSYDFMVTGEHLTEWYVPVTSESNGLTYETGIHYRELLRVWAQSLTVTFNFKF